MSRVTSDYALSVDTNGVLTASGQINGWWGSITIRSADPNDHTYSGVGRPTKATIEYLYERRLAAIVNREIMA